MTEMETINKAQTEIKILELKRHALIKELKHELITTGLSEKFIQIDSQLFTDFVLGAIVSGYQYGSNQK
jgi:hypothetical protein